MQNSEACQLDFEDCKTSTGSSVCINGSDASEVMAQTGEQKPPPQSEKSFYMWQNVTDCKLIRQTG